jgi:hypothetical protein
MGRIARAQPAIILLLATGALIVVESAISHHLRAKREDAREEAIHLSRFEGIRRAYTVALPPGTNRREVEQYFTGHKIIFEQFCCDTESGAPYDSVRIGEDSFPRMWFCGKWDVELRFRFYGINAMNAGANDVLRDITLEKLGVNCL